MFDETEATLPFLMQFGELQIALDMWWEEASDRFRCGELSVLRIAEVTLMPRATVYKKLRSYYAEGGSLSSSRDPELEFAEARDYGDDAEGR